MWTYQLIYNQTQTIRHVPQPIIQGKPIITNIFYVLSVWVQYLFLFGGFPINIMGRWYTATQSGKQSRASRAQPLWLWLLLLHCCGSRLIYRFLPVISVRTISPTTSLWLSFSPSLSLHLHQLFKCSLVSHTRCKEMWSARESCFSAAVNMPHPYRNDHVIARTT